MMFPGFRGVVLIDLHASTPGRTPTLLFKADVIANQTLLIG
jgi:hypothetical protein